MTKRCLVAPLLVLIAAAVGCGDFRRLAYEGFGGRDDWQQPDRVLASLGLAEGARVADLGSGGGYFTFRLAEHVGPQGQVYAVDVDEEMNAHIREKAAEEGHENVEVVLAEFDDPLIPHAVDLIFTSNTYHHLQERTAYFRNAAQYLKPGGRVAILEYRGGGLWQAVFGHNTDPALIRSEMEAAGYVLEKEFDFLERQGFLVFAPAETP